MARISLFRAKLGPSTFLLYWNNLIGSLHDFFWRICAFAKVIIGLGLGFGSRLISRVFDPGSSGPEVAFRLLVWRDSIPMNSPASAAATITASRLAAEVAS